MAAGQTILTVKSKYAIFLTLGIEPGGEDRVRDTLEGLSGRVRSVGSRNPDARLTVVTGIGSDAWDRLFAGARPKLLRPFKGYVGEVHTAPATPGDILLHIKAQTMDVCYEVGQLLTADFGDSVRTIEEIHGFRYFDLRDLTGFVDGTENPEGQAAVDTIQVDPADDPAFAGGSYITVQRYETDMAKWNGLTVEQQENVFGRSKSENVEMDDDVKPVNAHIAVNQVNDAEGNQLQIVRDNMPYGDASGTGVKGTYYIAYSKTPDVTDTMLEKMFIGDPPGNYDALLDFTTAVTGCEFFAPCADFLDALPPAPATTPAPPAEPAPAAPVRPADGSLGIGSLRRR
ncbi:Dyp-type peroxidase [Gordonia sp. (in: high G+C Gram-positive bacteria)]|uniref:Dyp-type peroxidase n=1 Tax=Gordonia sp. (in: high G+C Gram-positive bacteria) TaxID=84139 RepID=UPI0035294D5C